MKTTENPKKNEDKDKQTHTNESSYLTSTSSGFN